MTPQQEGGRTFFDAEHELLARDLAREQKCCDTTLIQKIFSNAKNKSDFGQWE
jgi:hypothetical protein